MTDQAINHKEREHALLSPSGAYRWLNCTPSAKLEASLPDTSSTAAAAGTLAHEIAELKLRKAFADPITAQKFNTELRKFKKHELYEPIMDKHTDMYLDYIKGIVHGYKDAPAITIERKVDISRWVPECKGTADCIVIAAGDLHLIDYKNGQGKAVTAEDNSQLKLYALGAVHAYSLLYPIERVHLHIVQPKVWDDPSTWSISVADLLAWGDSIKPIAAKAHAGEGDYVPGEHCDFCRAKSRCRARTEALLSIEDKIPLRPPLISWEEAAEILQRGEGLVKWYSALKDDALSHLLAGGDVPGYKAVHGRGSRAYVDLDAAFKHLIANKIEEALLYERKPLTPPALEKVIGKPQYRKLLEGPGHVIKTEGAPTLVTADDSRPAITGKVSAAEVFGDG